jgi:hypothetical protein
LSGLVRRMRALKSAVITPPWQPDGHYYSPVPSADDTARALSQAPSWRDVDLEEDNQRRLAAELLPVARRFAGQRWCDNPMFGFHDASVYFAVLDRLRPRRVVEVGSGYSTAVALDFGVPDVVSVEPYPDRLLEVIRRGDPVTLIRKPVQDVEVSTLTSGDLLFIDSTHVSKAGSDVNWLLFDVLPEVEPGTWVHFHDIFWPRGYPDAWLRERRAWNEAYLVRAFLAHNRAWRVRLFANWLWKNVPEFRQEYSGEPGSLWLERVA